MQPQMLGKPWREAFMCEAISAASYAVDGWNGPGSQAFIRRLETVQERFDG